MVSLSLLRAPGPARAVNQFNRRRAHCRLCGRWSTEITRPCMEESYFAYPFFIMSALPLSAALSHLGPSRLA